MPETPVNQDYFASRREHEIRGARKRLHMEAIAAAQGMNQSADGQFRSGVLRLHRPHDAGSLEFGERVSHGLTEYPLESHHRTLYQERGGCIDEAGQVPLDRECGPRQLM